jgi:hypothetical protein
MIMKILRWVTENSLFLLTLLMLIVIPLYPKLPLIDIKNTWVYIRVEDFLVAFVGIVWLYHLIKGKVTLRTPLTLPILIFWLIGTVATIHAVLIIFPSIANVFSNIALLSLLRRIEYISLFFIAFSAIKDKKHVPIIVGVLLITLLAVVAYGIGQRYLGFPAFLTMNEEYAKGTPVYLSQQSRVPSTFGGHYDLAAFLVLILPILTSMLFGFRNWFVRIALAGSVMAGFVLMFMTVSRVSFFVLLIALAVVIFLQKRKVVLFALPLGLLALILLLANFSSSLFDRFGNTVGEVDVLVEATTGNPIGHVKKVETSSFGEKIIVEREYGDQEDLLIDEKNPKFASSAAIIPPEEIPFEGIAVVPPNTPTGENLPQGTEYINLTLSPVTKRLSTFFYDRSQQSQQVETPYVTMFTGNFLVKRASAYDLSLTTRTQGEWPHAIEAFKRNILFGSGYSSISLAIDNNFLRILGEVGLLGFISFFGIFIAAGVYMRRVLPHVSSPAIRSFVLGFAAGVMGLFLNALLIDVFEASKVAYMLWLLMGITIGLLYLYQPQHFSLSKELKRALSSPLAMAIYIGVIGFVLFWPMVKNYYIGDDFTWLRWAADCSVAGADSCQSQIQRITAYFTQADGFFYRPGTKLYFQFMYNFFWLNQNVYHIVSIVLHILFTILLFLLIRKVSKNTLFASLATFLFLIISGYTEILFWIASTGHLFTAVFMLLSVLSFIYWEEKKNLLYLITSFVSLVISLLFYEQGVIVPLLVLAYKFVTERDFSFKKLLRNTNYLLLYVPVTLYLIIRFFAESHWSGGDYSYNVLKLPFNFIGNLIGYFFLSLLGPLWLSVYQSLRGQLQNQIGILTSIVIIVGLISVLLLRSRIRFMVGKVIHTLREERTLLFALLFFVISLLPFLGFGNITSRYSYVATGGAAMLFALGILQLYRYLIRNGRDIALISLATLLSIFTLFHISQTQEVHSDWYEAGQRTQKFIISMEEAYEDHWAYEPMTYHFVNVPIKHGNAWIFPWGLSDALWLVFQNPRITVHQHTSTASALEQVNDIIREKVFVFQEDGRVKEVKKYRYKNTEAITDPTQ